MTNKTNRTKNLNTSLESPALKAANQLKHNGATDDELVSMLKGMEFQDREIFEALTTYGMAEDDIENGIEAWDMLEGAFF